MQPASNNLTVIQSNYIFDGSMAMKGYALNKMCYSFNSAENRKKFKNFPEAYCHNYGLSREQILAVTDLDVKRMLQLGGNIYYLAKLTAIYGMSANKFSNSILCTQATSCNVN